MSSSNPSSSSSGDEEFECLEGSFGARTQCILTYHGSKADILINYAVLLVNLAYCGIALSKHWKDQLPDDGSTLNRKYPKMAIGSLVGVIIFQISLCLILGCSGISIVWCAVGGWLMQERRSLVDAHILPLPSQPTGGGNNSDNHHPTTTTSSGRINPGEAHNSNQSWGEVSLRLRDWGKWVIFLDLIVIVYYAIALPAITTVAHICALILGAILCTIAIRVSFAEHSTSTMSTTGVSHQPSTAYTFSETSALSTSSNSHNNM